MQQQQQFSQMVQPQFTFEGGHLVMFHQEATGLPMVKDANVNDRDRMQDLLATEKYMTVGYTVSMNEASHDGLFKVLKQNQDAVHQMQRQLFNTMFKKGWYKLPVADAGSVAHAHSQFKQYQTQFPFSSQQQSQSTTGTQTGQKLDQAVNQAIQQAQQGQVPHVSIAQQTATQQTTTQGTTQYATAQKQVAMHAGGTSTTTQQQLNQKVDQAIQQAQQGQVPTGYQAPSRTH